MVRGDGIRRERPAVGRSQQRHDRACRRRGADARGAVGEELGVQLVQAGDGGAQLVDGEKLASPVDLAQNDDLPLVGADVELPAGYTAR